MVEAGFDREPDFRFNVSFPGQVTVTIVGSVELAHANPVGHVQLENV